MISDTHGLLRPEAVAALAGSDLILHAGDVGGPEILEALRRIAPLHTVRGNNDREPWADELPETLDLELAGVRIRMLHDAKTLRGDPARDGVAVLVAGHSHAPRVERRGSMLHLNPGSAGPRRFRLPVALARLTLRDGVAAAEIVTLL